MSNKKIKLPINYKKIYKNFYKEYALSSTLIRKIASFFESWYHRKIAKIGGDNLKILEVGCGSLNHVFFEKNYFKYDVVEPKNFLIKVASDNRKAVISNFYNSLDSISSKKRYGKIISIVVLEHISNLEEHILKIKKLMAPNGILAVAIPAEGEFLWWLSWRLTTGVAFWLKYKLDYGVIMRYEHVNDSKQIIDTLKKYFVIKKINAFPFNLKNWRIYITLECKLKD